MYKKTKHSIILLLMLFASLTAYSQSNTLTLDAAIKMALENNSDTKIAELDVQQASTTVKEAYGYAMPTVNLSASLSHFFKKPQIPFIDFEALLNNATYGVLFDEGVIAQDDSKFLPMGSKLMSMSMANNVKAEAQITQILFNAAVIKGIGSAQVYFDMSKYMLEQQAVETIHQVTKTFYGCVLAKEMLEITEASLTNFERNYKSVLALYDAGFVSEYDKLTAEVQYENFKPNVNNARSAKIAALNGLKVLLAINPTEELDVSGSLDYKQNSDWAENKLIEEALTNNYDIGALEYKQKIDDAFIDLEKADFWPTVAAFGSFSYNGQSDTWDMLSYNQALAGVSFSMNIFQGMQSTNKVQNKRVERMKTDETLRFAKDAIKMQIRNKMVDLELIEANILAAEKNIILAEKGYQISESRYKEGDGTQVELMNAELQLRAAKTNVLQYYYNYISTTEDIKYLAGEVNEEYIRNYRQDTYQMPKK